MTIGEFWREISYLCKLHGGSVTSGHRTIDRNRQVGGAADSQHLGYKAADIVLDDWTHKDDLILNAKLAGLWVLDEVVTKNHVHVDERHNV